MEKIGIIVPEAKNGGAEKQAIYLMKALSDEYECSYIILYPNSEKEPNWDSFSLNSNCHIVRIQAKNEIKRIIELYRILKSEKISYLFCYLTKPDFYGSIIGRCLSLKKVFLGIRNDSLPKWKIALEKIANMFSTGVIINNYCGKEKFEKSGLNKIIVIPNCYINFHQQKYREEKDHISIVTVGRFVAQKDYETAIKAISEAQKEIKEIRYIIVGFGELEEQIRKWIKLYNVEDSVTLEIDPENVFKILSESDIYLCSSLFEGTSNSIMEAMDASLPIIATNVGDNGLLVENNHTGYIVNKGNSHEMAEKIIALSQARDTRLKMGINGNERLREFYSLERFKKHYLELLKK